MDTEKVSKCKECGGTEQGGKILVRVARNPDVLQCQDCLKVPVGFFGFGTEIAPLSRSNEDLVKSTEVPVETKEEVPMEEPKIENTAPATNAAPATGRRRGRPPMERPAADIISQVVQAVVDYLKTNPTARPQQVRDSVKVDKKILKFALASDEMKQKIDISGHGRGVTWRVRP